MRILYRLRQGLHLVAAFPLSPEEKKTVAAILPPCGVQMFNTMSKSDQRHSWNVYSLLSSTNSADMELLQAALLHDVGKSGGRVHFWVRPCIVIMKTLMPQTLRRIISGNSRLYWKRQITNAWNHAEIGAQLATEAGLADRVSLLIRTHHLPDGPAAELHKADEKC